ncbi:DsbA family protein [Nocardia sp. IBHARD005]|uniref:DsbA family protein n=1 Tax=Nocardia sp. IBHARD005 TaxID=3457765 RepID=UPI00405895FB
MSTTVEIWTDINCPFCYLGKARFEQALADFAHRDDVDVVHRSFELDPTLPADSTRPVIAAIAEKYGITVDQAAANERGIMSAASATVDSARTDRPVASWRRLAHHRPDPARARRARVRARTGLGRPGSR